ncbi:MAG TPA: WYL domain-containing protein [Myxococcales bacterium]|nr:WYL domain-containing protein [Myxococcales bacterium]
MEKTERLLDLVALLLSAREPVPFAELRELFPDEYGGGSRDAAQRKLERDKAELLKLGVPIEYVEPIADEREAGGYRIDRSTYFLPDPKLLPEEAAALYAAGAAALEARDFPFAHDLQHALGKISLSGEAAASSASRRLLVVRPGRGQYLKELGDAVARRKRVHIVYSAPPSLDGKPGEKTFRDVDPWGLAFRGGAWRLVGYCHLRKAQRVFVVDRIETATVNERNPASADFETPKDFDAGAVAGRKPWQWEGGKPQEVRLRFAPGSEALAERAFEGGSFTATSIDGLIPSVLQHGDKVEIVEPLAARAKLREALQRIARLLEREPDALGSALPSIDEPELKPLKPERYGKQERLRRLLLVVPLARKRPGIKLDELAKELRIEPEELREDIELLGYVGRPPFSPDDLIDISVDERGRVHVALDQSFERPPQLQPLEALALAAACEEVAPADPAVREALDKLTSKLTPAARDLYAQLAKRLVSAVPLPREAADALPALRRAAEQRRELSLRYDSLAKPARLFHPQGVIDHAGVWYAIGHDATRGAERTFRVDRILEVSETGNTFQDPGPLDASRFQRERLFLPSGREQPVVLRFSSGAAAWALFRYGSRARALPDGRAEVWIDSEGSAYAVSLALSFAGEAEIAFPLEARAALRAAVESTLRPYT